MQRVTLNTWKPIVVVCLMVVTAPAQSPTTWFQFLGPNRNGISKVTGLVDQFPKSGPREVWRVRGGTGMSGLAVTQKNVFTMIQSTQDQYLLSLDRATGKQVWQTRLAPAYKNGQGDGPRSTPTVVGGQIIALTGQGVLVSVGIDGTIGWSTDLFERLGGKVADYGMSCSPLVVDDQVVVNVGAPGAAVVGLSLRDGAILWKTGNGPAGYSSPALLDVNGQQQIVAFIGNQVLGIEPKSGRQLWSYPFVTDYACNTATPISIGGKILITAGENHGSILLDPRRESADEVGEVWESLGPKSSIRSEWQTPVLIDGYLYGFDNVGSAGPVTHLVCVNAASGEQVWREPRFGKGNLIAADGKLIISTMAGELILARVDPQAYHELARAEVIGKTRQAPALSGTTVLLRDDSEIVCLELAK